MSSRQPETIFFFEKGHKSMSGRYLAVMPLMSIVFVPAALGMLIGSVVKAARCRG